jgi:hypothetical protein
MSYKELSSFMKKPENDVAFVQHILDDYPKAFINLPA